jgi:hypothetical protein
MKRATHPRRSTKLKKTFSLSPDSVDFLKQLAKKYRSDSEALDAIIREKKMKAEKQRIAAAVTSYYDCLSGAEQDENRAWGEFAESQFPEE